MQLEQVQEMDIDMDILILLSEAFFGTWQTSIIELFCENSYRLKALKKLSAKKKTPSEMFVRVLSTHLFIISLSKLLLMVNHEHDFRVLIFTPPKTGRKLNVHNTFRRRRAVRICAKG